MFQPTRSGGISKGASPRLISSVGLRASSVALGEHGQDPVDGDVARAHRRCRPRSSPGCPSPTWSGTDRCGTGPERREREEIGQPEDGADGAQHLEQERPAGHRLDAADQRLASPPSGPASALTSWWPRLAVTSWPGSRSRPQRIMPTPRPRKAAPQKEPCGLGLGAGHVGRGQPDGGQQGHGPAGRDAQLGPPGAPGVVLVAPVGVVLAPRDVVGPRLARVDAEVARVVARACWTSSSSSSQPVPARSGRTGDRSRWWSSSGPNHAHRQPQEAKSEDDPDEALRPPARSGRCRGRPGWRVDAGTARSGRWPTSPARSSGSG